MLYGKSEEASGVSTDVSEVTSTSGLDVDGSVFTGADTDGCGDTSNDDGSVEDAADQTTSGEE